ncbi:DUF2790 domain-containing protein [Pseudomonas sp. PB120]|uniref:DUF2790 domain-containing protein n=1 Tax=Pseudomonas sp. PB120 TaxID=2494700 RepID=UPI0012FD0069|nr:DUF2790 domain-containing protein [Pseudomonas sp. PB120]MVV49689.1 DUF2790 domain-containing protein [Pseudomonas sp. PB120]
MNRTRLIAASFFALLNVAAFSAHADAQSQPQTHANAHLDIKQVISTVEDSSANCGIVNARMTYLDSSGTRKVLDYSKLADCGNQGS